MRGRTDVHHGGRTGCGLCASVRPEARHRVDSVLSTNRRRILPDRRRL